MYSFYSEHLTLINLLRYAGYGILLSVALYWLFPQFWKDYHLAWGVRSVFSKGSEKSRSALLAYLESLAMHDEFLAQFIESRKKKGSSFCAFYLFLACEPSSQVEPITLLAVFLYPIYQILSAVACCYFEAFHECRTSMAISTGATSNGNATRVFFEAFPEIAITASHLGLSFENISTKSTLANAMASRMRK